MKSIREWAFSENPKAMAVAGAAYAPGLCNEHAPVSGRFRVVAFGDSQKAERTAWMREVIGDFTEFRYSENDTAFLSVAEEGYDCLIVHGNDARRIQKLARNNQPLLVSKPKICVLKGSVATERAAILNAGYDDVFDIAKMHPIEARCRLHAILSRHRQASGTRAVADLVELSLACIADHTRLTERERRVLLHFIRTGGNAVVSYNWVKINVSSGPEPVSDIHMRVFMSKLRKKLKDTVRIVPRSNRGYVLEWP